MKRRAHTFLVGLWTWLAAAGVVLAEQRFPPPDFESGYQLPVTQTPAPRAAWLQYFDVLVLLVALGLACHLILRKRSRAGVVGLSLFSLLYFGFYRQGCICAIGSVQNVALALFDRSYALPVTVLVFCLAPVVFSLVVGRAFCAAVCPHGALQDLVLLKPLRVPGWLEHALGVLPYLYLGAGVMFAATGSAFLICRYDPFVPLFRLSGSFLMLTTGAAFVVLGMFVGRPYCRFVCPYGALLRLGALVARWRVRVTPDFCTQCQLCEHSCPFGAMREPTAPAANPATQAADRRRLGWLLLLLPVLVAAGAWLGGRLSVPLARLDPNVALAEKFLDPKKAAPLPGVQTPQSLALGRAEENPKELLAAAAAARQKFATASWLFGGWVGLVIGVKLIGLSLRAPRTDFEPDRGACFGCARCFSFCPNERVRLGLQPVPANVQAPMPVAATAASVPPAKPA
jgi:polyferredoxin